MSMSQDRKGEVCMAASRKTAKAATKDVETAAKAEAAAVSEKETKKAAAAAVEAAKAVKKEAAPKAAAKKTPAKKTTVRKTVKKADQKTSLHVQFSGKSYSQEDFIKMAQDIWEYDLNQKAGELGSIELYVKPEENVVYYVMNQEFTGSFGV